MWEQALEDALQKLQRNIANHPGQLPHITERTGSLSYEWDGNWDWIEGFYIGMMWLAYEYKREPVYRDAAESYLANFQDRLDRHVALDHHDIGFLYSLSAVAQWRVTGSEEAKELALRAADLLVGRFRPQIGIIQAWGKEGDPENGGRMIIDCLLNLPLLFWAHEQTGKSEYYDIAMKHALMSQKFLIRGDGSSYHTFYFNPENGHALRGETHQGYQDGSTWTRGQAWGIYGFALAYRYTGYPAFLETSKKMARYFIKYLPEDAVVYWDFDVPVEEGTPRDSSASAIVACGLLELLKLTEEDDPEREWFAHVLNRSMKSLAGKYATTDLPDAEGLLKHGSYHVRGDRAPDDFMIWGDYFYLEALVRLEKGIQGYW
ncbi:glycoside hydrolase family 88 protein [Paenibacillus sp. Marseille-P2973]|uniref:glycoside hydrolase family 88 protein n=1 Tax=Paenibacillus sp. Marseille-P2973 TaxID=1871032 RepID=UPI001B358BF1|nr:glycoside hydrolase family 88 protein [Paenibacillus sp. Marseille-P2973]MBQ4900239.1 glycoside hydrolase family 88 protein [Paenibacillus sp. Marseille-P2973]